MAYQNEASSEVIITDHARTRMSIRGIMEWQIEQVLLYGRQSNDDTQMILFTVEGILHAWTAARHCCHPPNFQGALHHAYLRWLYTQHEVGISKGGWLLDVPKLHNSRATGGTCISSLAALQAGTVQTPVYDCL